MHNLEVKGIVKKASEYIASEVLLDDIPTVKNLAKIVKDYMDYNDLRVICCEDEDGNKFMVIEEI